MVKSFFNRFSVMVRVMEVVGVLFMAALAVRLASSGSALSWTLFAVVLVEYAFIRFCATHRWYPSAPRGSGIELHFLKAVVPIGYVLALTGLFAFLMSPAPPLAVAALLLALIAHLNVILLYFHLRDDSLLPVNAFSGSASPPLD